MNASNNRFLLALLVSATRTPTDRKAVTPLMLKELTDMPGKETLVITVGLSPGAEHPVHRHDCPRLRLRLEGSIVMQ